MLSSKLAIEGGKPTRERPWPPLHYCDQADESLLLSALRQNNWSNGEQVREFERFFAAFCGCKYALLVVNCTTALKLALLAAGIKPGDEVIVPGVTWPSVAIAIIECGAEPVPADISSQTYGISVESVQKAMTEKTRAVIPTHLFCSQTDLTELLELTNARNIKVIEDCAHSVGARRFGKFLGTFGAAGVFSFNQKKLLACGEGGCLITNDEDLFVRAKAMREVSPDIESVPANLPGTHMVSEFQAAVLRTQLEQLPGRLSLIEQRAEFLRLRLNRIDGIEVLRRLPSTDMQTFYGFCFKAEGVKDIVWFRKALAAEIGLPIGGAYIPLSESLVVDTSRDRRYSNLGSRLKKQLPNCMHAHYNEAVRFYHNALTADEASMIEIETAVAKVMAASHK